MKAGITTLLIIFVLISRARGQEQPEHNVRVDGFVTTIRGNALQYVNIINLNKRTGTITDAKGSFRIAASPDDTLVFSSVGFQNKKMRVQPYPGNPVYPVHIYLQEDTITLSGVTIHDWPRNLTALRQAVLAQKIEEPAIADLNLNVVVPDAPQPGSPITLPGMGNPGLTYTIPGPITALYNAFSRRGKSMQRYAELTRQDRIHEMIARKYNPEIVKDITGFKSDEEIIAFMDYCNLSVSFLLNATEYEILCSVKDCLANYLAEKQQ